ncbi:hypothetical protein C8J57DRAFT_1561158 [Mycena rebaudengoi]|nr:hypothetical protein C8J57DRAFT_1561158 [Mycena rebaudengoi]
MLTTAPSPCVQKCASASNDPGLTSCNPSDGACLCISESFLKAVEVCVFTACPDDLPNANAFLGSQCAIATRSLLDPRQDAGASTVPEDPATATSAFSNPSSTSSLPSVTPSPSRLSSSSFPSSGSPSGTQPTTTSTGPPAPSHKLNTAAIAGGVVGGLLTIALITITIWCMRGRFRPPPLPPPIADRVNELRSPSVLTFDGPVPPSVLERASSAGSLASSSQRVPEKTPNIDREALWHDSYGSQSSGTRYTRTMSVVSGSGDGSTAPTSSNAAGSGGARSVRPDPATQMQLRAMAERIAQLEAESSTRGASSAAVDELPPNYTPGP